MYSELNDDRQKGPTAMTTLALTAQQDADIRKALNTPPTIDYLRASNAGFAVWDAHKGDDLDTVQVYEGCKRVAADRIKAQYHQLDRNEFSREVAAFNRKVPLRRGHTYRVYVRYARSNISNIRVFTRVEIIDHNALVGPSGTALLVGKIEL